MLGKRPRNAKELIPAREALDEARKFGLDPSDVSVMLAARCLELGDHHAVVGLLEDQDRNLSTEANLILAKSLQVLRQPVKAAYAARRLLSINQPGTWMARDLLRAQAYAILGDYGRAVGLLERQGRRKEIEPLIEEIYSSWLAESTGMEEKASTQDFVLLERGLAWLPLRPELLGQFVRFSQAVSQESLDAAFGDVASPLIVHLRFGLQPIYSEFTPSA